MLQNVHVYKCHMIVVVHKCQWTLNNLGMVPVCVWFYLKTQNFLHFKGFYEHNHYTVKS